MNISTLFCMEVINRVLGSSKEFHIGIALILALVLPHTNSALLLVNPLLCISFMLREGVHIDRLSLLPIYAVAVSLVLGVISGVGGKAVLSAFSIILCLIAFPYLLNTSIKNIYVYICFFIIFVSQIGYIIHLNFIISFVDSFYPIGWNEEGINNMIDNVDIENYISFRLGGLFRNPNHLAKYVSFLMAIYLVNNRERPIGRVLLFTSICLLSILLTGSRTGFVIASGLVFLFLYKCDKVQNNNRLKLLLLLFGLCVVLFVVYVGSENARSIAIGEGLNDSAGLKLFLTLDYLIHEASIFQLLFGNLDFELYVSPYEYSFDCDYGYIIYSYGIIGLIAFSIFLIRSYIKTNRNQRLFYVVLLWMITSSIIMSYRAVFAFFLLLSTIYRNDYYPEKSECCFFGYNCSSLKV